MSQYADAVPGLPRNEGVENVVISALAKTAAHKNAAPDMHLKTRWIIANFIRYFTFILLKRSGPIPRYKTAYI